METSAIRQRITLSDQLSVLQSASNLRDLLRFQETDTNSRRRSSVTLAAVLEAEKNAAYGVGGGRTLLDVIREEEEARGRGDRLEIRPAATTLAAERSDEGSGTIRVSLMTLMEMREREEAAAEAARMRAAVAALTGVNAGDADVEEEIEEEEEDPIGGRERHVCCVCMVRKKGAAFIPCGHTFCRICSREMLINRGNCPLCNASILEVLDIF